jgi:hypothetical protein
MGIFTLNNRAVSPVAKLFIEHAREVAKPLANKSRNAMSGNGLKRTISALTRSSRVSDQISIVTIAL